MYDLQYTKHAEREIRKLDSKVQTRIYEILLPICENPYQHVEALIRPKGAEPLYKLAMELIGLLWLFGMINWSFLLSVPGIERVFIRKCARKKSNSHQS